MCPFICETQKLHQFPDHASGHIRVARLSDFKVSHRFPGNQGDDRIVSEYSRHICSKADTIDMHLFGDGTHQLVTGYDTGTPYTVHYHIAVENRYDPMIHQHSEWLMIE